jgi:hypothetical protein
VTTRRGTDAIVQPGDMQIIGTPYADVFDGSDSPDGMFGRGGDDILHGYDHK